MMKNPRTMIFDWKNTFVLLLGASEFKDDSIHDIPNVKANIRELRKILRNPDIIGIQNIVDALDLTKQNTLKRLSSVLDNANRIDKTLIVYYAGHGIMSPENGYKVYLATKDIDNKNPDIDGIGLDYLAGKIKNCFAGRKILILDACHSGQIVGLMSNVHNLYSTNLDKVLSASNNQDVQGVYVLASAGENEVSLYPVDKPNEPTFFTGKFIDILQNGLNTAHEFISMDEIFKELYHHARLNKFPEPIKRSHDLSGDFKIALNKQYSSEKKELSLLIQNRASLQAISEFAEKINNPELKMAAADYIYQTKELNAWKRAHKKDVESAYRQFLRAFPGSRFEAEANKQLQKISDQEDWYWVKKENKPETYKEYLRKYPAGMFATTARKKILHLRDEERWLQAFATNTRKSFIDYLTDFHSGEHYDEAIQKIEDLKPKSNLLIFKSKQESVDILLFKAEMSEAKGNNKDAREYYAAALKLAPANPFLKSRLVALRGIKSEKEQKAKPKVRIVWPKVTRFTVLLLIFSLILIFAINYRSDDTFSYTQEMLQKAKTEANEKRFDAALLTITELSKTNNSDSIMRYKSFYEAKLEALNEKLAIWLQDFEWYTQHDEFGKASSIIDSLSANHFPNDKLIILNEKLEIRKKNLIHTYLRKADLLAETEESYLSALNHYQQALAYSPSNALLKNRIKQLNEKLDDAFNKHIKRAKLFMKSRIGKLDAQRELDKALLLKPNDAELINLLDELSANENY